MCKYMVSLQGPPTEGAGPGILSGSHQEHLCGGRAKFTPGQGVLPQDGSTGRNRELIPWWIHRGVGDGGSVDKEKSRGVGGVRPHISRGGPQVPAVCIRGTAEVTPTGVGIRAAGQPRDRRCVRPSGGGDCKGVPPGIIRGSGRWCPGEGNHPPVSAAGRDGPPRSDAGGP